MARALALKLEVPTEAQEQQDFFLRVSHFETRFPELKRVYHVPNGAYLGENRHRYANKLKAQGLRPGVPDICFPMPTLEYNGLYIELKRLNARPSDTTEQQREWHTFLRAQGYAIYVCKGWVDAWNTLCAYYPPLQGQEVK
jgi:hypothetical protein